MDHNLKFVLSVGGWGAGNFSTMAMTEEGRQRFAASCKAYAKKSRKNWAIAQLIIAAVMIVLMIILGAVLSASIASIVNSLW